MKHSYWVGLCLQWCLLVQPAMALTVHVKPGGANDASGDAEHPVGMLYYAVQKVSQATEPCEIIIHAGRYFERMDLGNPKMPEGQPIPPLVIRAAEGEVVIIDGAMALTKATPLAGQQGVYVFNGDFGNGVPPQVWEPLTRTRYIGVADVRSVAAFPGTCALIDKRTAAIHTTDGRSPAEAGALASYHLFGIFSYRDNLTVRGLRFENHLGWSWAASVNLQGGQNILVEDCSAANSIRGFVSFKSSKTRFNRCSVQDVGGGIYSGGQDVVVENCVLAKIRDRYMIEMVTQDDSAIQYYSPAHSGIVRGNLVRGFHYGIFFKAAGTFVAEHNTVIDVAGATFNNTWASGEPSMIRRNIFADCDLALLYPPPKGLPPGAVFDENLCWGGDRAKSMQENLDQIKGLGFGAGDASGDPMFVDSTKGDYRVKPESPAVKLAKDGAPWGALPMAKGDQPPTILLPPPIPGTEARTVDPIVIAPKPPREGPARILYVARDGQDQTDRGSQEKPLASLAYAMELTAAGDTVRIAPGLYLASPLVIRRSGTAEKPITIEAVPGSAPDAVILDGLKRTAFFTIENASYIVIRNLSMRWGSFVGIKDSSHITVSGCRFQNHYWAPAFVDGAAIHVNGSPDCVFDHNIIARVGTGIYLIRSPGATITNNSATAMDYGGLWLLDSCKGTRVYNNAFCFAGNDSLLIQEGSLDAFRGLEMDYNNWAASVFRGPDAMKVPFDYLGQSKAVILVTVPGYESKVALHAENRLHTLAEWQAYSGKDAHSIFADPKWIDPATGKWELAHGSPNIGAGKDGKTIGATELSP